MMQKGKLKPTRRGNIKHQNPTTTIALAQRRAAVTAPNPVLRRVAPLPLAAMGSCLSTQPGDEPAWPLRWRKRPHGEREGAAAGGAGGGGGKKLPGEGEMTEEELARVAGRTCANGASAAACLHTQQGRKGTNQDAMVVWEVSCRRLATAICFPCLVVCSGGFGVPIGGGGARSTADSWFKAPPF